MEDGPAFLEIGTEHVPLPVHRLQVRASSFEIIRAEQIKIILIRYRHLFRKMLGGRARKDYRLKDVNSRLKSKTPVDF